MNIDKAIEHKTRHEILNLLSDEEAAVVSTAETRQIPEGEEYLDLEHLDRGIQRADLNTPGSHTLPRTAVRATTWDRIMTVLETPVAVPT